MVPVSLAASFLVVNQWYDDHTLGNFPMVGWSFFFAAIACLLLTLATFRKKKTDAQGNTVGRKHDFFFLPIIIWTLLFGGVSAYMLLVAGKSAPKKSEKLTYKNMETMPRSDVRTIHFYNPTADSIQYIAANTGGLVDRKWLAPGETAENKFAAGTYFFAAYDQKEAERLLIPNKKYKADNTKYVVVTDAQGQVAHRKVNGGTTEMYDYDDAWVLLDGNYDLLLVNVTEVCNEKADETQIKEIDWTENIYGDYDGMDLVEPYIQPAINDKLLPGYITLLQTGEALPRKPHVNESVYVWIPYRAGNKPTPSDIAAHITKLGYR